MTDLQNAHRRLDALEQVVADLQNRIDAGGGSTSQSGSTGRTAVSSFYEGLVVGRSSEVFSRLFKGSYSVTSLTIEAGTAPTQSGGMDFEIRVNGTVQTTITLGQGTALESYDLGLSVSEDDVLAVTPAQTSSADALSDVHLTFALA